MTLRFSVHGTAETIELPAPRVIVAGYTGADAAAVQEHIDELAAIGVAPPESVPAFYPMPDGAATQDAVIRVPGDATSGEVEPVLIRAQGRLFLGVGSDHTDRELERESVLRSKAVCPKPVSRTVIAVPEGGLDLDRIALRSSGDGIRYQQGRMSALRSPLDVLALWDADHEREDVVLFGGTVPLLTGAFVHGARWEVSLTVDQGAEITHTYAVETHASAPGTTPASDETRIPKERS